MNSNKKRQKLIKKLASKEYRDAWVDESVKTVIPFQIQAMRNQREWSQEILGEKSGMKQAAVSRLENMDYGNLSVNSLLRIAHGFDCGLLVKFVPFKRMVKEFEDVSPAALEVNEYEKDINDLQSWSSGMGKTSSKTVTVNVPPDIEDFGDFNFGNLDITPAPPRFRISNPVSEGLSSI